VIAIAHRLSLAPELKLAQSYSILIVHIKVIGSLFLATARERDPLPCWEEKEEDRDNQVNGKKLGAFEPIAFAVSAD
jgi:hypothetical protein